MALSEVIQELIELAKDIRTAHQRGKEEGLSQEEISFYDALAQNESAVEVMGNDQLRVIAHELLSSLKSNASVDWQHRESARARMRILVKRILRKYGYPLDLQDAAVQTVLQQAEVLSAGPSSSKRSRATAPFASISPKHFCSSASRPSSCSLSVRRSISKQKALAPF